MAGSVTLDLPAIRAGGKAALARALAAVETAGGPVRHAALLDTATANPVGEVLGITGPPGVGKSTLLGALITAVRAEGRTVGVIAVDPSSRFTGGALLGDRTRLRLDPDDQGVFVRSVAARDRLGGLSDTAIAATALMRAVFDLVIVETVGIGQSEADIALVADIVALCVQPGAGDTLQFMKAGIMELPDLFIVTKADLGPPADRARHELEAAVGLSLARTGAGRETDVAAGGLEGSARIVKVSATSGDVAPVLAAVAAARAAIGAAGIMARRERSQAAWIADLVRAAHGREGLALWRRQGDVDPKRPFRSAAEATGWLSARLAAAGAVDGSG